MKKLKKLSAAILLLVALTGSAMAGHIGTDAVPPPPPPPTQSATVAESDQTATDAIPSQLESETLISEITLSLLQLLSVI